MRITLEDIFNIPTAEIYNPDKYKAVTSVSIDTRSIRKNSIYVALKGKNFDGHNFVNDAVKNGAKAIVVSKRKLNQFEDVTIPIIAVKNTLDAYAELARIWRNKLNATVISITGSNGKTSTKEILAHLLEAKYKVHKTKANNNNHIGVPLTILSAPLNTEVLVLEHGSNHFGEIEATATVAEPDLALITNIGNSHIQYLESKEKILEEKIQLFKSVKKNGTVFINSEDPLLKSVKNKFSNKITYGFKGKVDIKGIKKKEANNNGLEINGLGKVVEVSLPLLGVSNFSNYLAAISVALKIGLSKKDIIKQTNSLQAVKGRLVEKRFKDCTLIDDTYNANPESVRIAIKVLKEFKNRSKKILVLGDMLELGEKAEAMHRSLGKDINSSNIDEVYLYGKLSKKLFDEIKNVNIKKHFSNRDSLLKYLGELEITDSVILFKGSRGMKMEEYLSAIQQRIS